MAITSRRALPQLSAQRRPGLKFRLPASVQARYDGTVRAAASSPAEHCIEIMSVIGDDGWEQGVTAVQVKRQLEAAAKKPVRVQINSPGGDAFEGIAIYNVIRDHPHPVTMEVLSLAASAASIIAMAGDRIEMREGAMMMIHSAWGLVAGNRDDLLEFADLLDKIDQSVAELYARRTGMPMQQVLQLMADETYMTGPEAVENGFADVCVPGPDKDVGARASSEFPVVSLAAAHGRSAARPAVMMSANLPGAAGSLSGARNVKTIQEQIQAFEATRAARADRAAAIMAKAGDEGRTLDAAETQEYDGLVGEVEAIDGHLVRLRRSERLVVARAVAPADQPSAVVRQAPANPDGNVLFVRSNLEKGIAFTRYVKALAMAKGNPMGALAIVQGNKKWHDETPQIEKVLMAAVVAGDTTTAGWASELVYNENLVNEFLEFLRPMTIIGRLPDLLKVPFNVRWGSQTSGSTANWVGQAKPIPVSKLTTGSGTLGIAKAAGLVVLTEELVRSSQPSAEIMVRNDLANAIAQFLDQQFIAPDYAAVANVSPASITNGVVPTAASGTAASNLRQDVQTLFGAWIAANIDPRGGCWVMTPTTALSISLMISSLGEPLFPRMTINGGEFIGLPAVVSNSAKQVGSPVSSEGNLLALCHCPSIALADEGGLVVDASREAALEMLDNPTNDGSTPTATSMVSMFQTDSVAIRAVRFINWSKRRSSAVAYIKDAAYVAT